MDHPQLSIDHSGSRPTVVKEAQSGPAAERLRREIVNLQAAEHPGVVGMVSSTDDKQKGVELRLRFGGSRTLANITQMPVEKVAGLIAALCTTVADLHELGVTHRRLTADHVLISADGRPILCGMADAQLGSGADDRHTDVGQLGELLRDLVSPMDNVAPIPDTKIGRRSSWSGYQRRALLNLADQATADDPHLRPSARQLAANIRSTVPGAALPENDNWDVHTAMPFASNDDESAGADRPTPLDRLRSFRPASLGAGAAAVTIVAALAVVLAQPGSSTDVGTSLPASTPTPSSLPTTTPPRISTTVSSAVDSTEASPPATTVHLPPPPDVGDLADAEPDVADPELELAGGCSTMTGADEATLASGGQCPVSIRIANGVLTVADNNYHLGLADAAIAIGDFACSGTVAAAVLDRDQGDIYVFGAWASPGEPVTATALQRIEQGSRLLAEPGLHDCHTLVALDNYGVRHIIPTNTQIPTSDTPASREEQP